MRFLLLALAAFLAAAAPLQAADQGAPAFTTLNAVIERALVQSPSLAAARSRTDAAAAGRTQASALPNPEVALEADNIYGGGPFEGMDSAEVTLGISQTLELPGKRGGRVAVADAQHGRQQYIRDARQLDLVHDLTIAYADMAAAQEEVGILTQELALATEIRDTVTAKVEAGKEPSIQKNKAEIERATREIALERAQRNLTAHHQRLIALMGGASEAISVSMDGLAKLVAPLELEVYRVRLAQTPESRMAEVDIIEARSTLSLEQAGALPDPTFNFGIKELRGEDERAFVAGISVPFPVFNMNRTGIERAGHEMNAAILDEQGAHLSREAQLVQTYQDFSNAYGAATSLQYMVLPGAEEAFSFARQGYDAGKFDYLEMLDAQRTLFDARKQLNAALRDYYHQRAMLDRLTTAYISQKDQINDQE